MTRPRTALLALLLATHAAHAQFGWDPTCSTSNMTWSLDVNGDPATGDGIDSGGWNQWVSGVPAFNSNIGNQSGRRIGFPSGQGPCADIGSVHSYIRVNGLGTNQLTLDLLAVVRVKHTCNPEICPPWDISADAMLNATACLIINAGLGPDVTINYDYTFTSRMSRRHEAGAEDPCNVSNTRLNIANQAGFALGVLDVTDAASFPAFASPAPVFSASQSDAGSFAFDPTSGPLVVNARADVDAHIENPGNGRCLGTNPARGHKDVGWAVFFGRVALGINQPPPETTRLGLSLPSPTPPGFNPGDLAIEFGIDIGSDTERSDTASPANNVFDPGDLYTMGAPALPPAGADGVRDDDDAHILPTAPDPGPTLTAPICSFPPAPDLPALGSQFLDTDASDALDLDLLTLINPAAPLAAPIARFANPTVHPANHLLISYDDDDATHYAWCSVAPFSLTSASFAPYGDDTGADELRALDLLYTLPLLGTLTSDTPVARESDVHTSLRANPDPGENADDDVDSLDAQWAPGYADHWYLSVDSEAHAFDATTGVDLDPGVIYLASPASPSLIAVIDPATHLGLLPGVDIDAFEFVWLYNPAIDDEALALIFSVDDDDPLTPDDESAALDPAMLYVSFFDGAHAPLLTDPLDDDVDALTTWSRSLASELPLACPADLAPPFGLLDFSDVLAFLNAFANADPIADLNPDGLFDFSDVLAFLSAFAAGCP